uniref:F-box domain-containing protein n=1 Tax=Skeletonema marinoi TaxID=267567 RepID=A0A7S1CVQ5_9STRA|mmetsp:Transcript_869/g.1220  ORF Transcript_869/g.1220 Transcript_869/m.1220 type:complete len:424 (+) Transcript_869:85-1356(+)
MPQSKKPNEDAANTAAVSIPSDELANIFGCLGPIEILHLRRVCKTWNDAAKNTIVPLTDFKVHDIDSYNTMRTMATALPNLQQLELGSLTHILTHMNSSRIGPRYVNGEDPDEEEALRSINDITYEVDMVSNFTKLRVLKLENACLNGKYPYLFNFPLLQHLTISDCPYLKWDLGVLGGFPLLKEFDCTRSEVLTGNISSLRVLKDTLERVTLQFCPQVEGNFMDLADFPQLKSLILRQMDSITGDIRDVGAATFPKLENILLPYNVYGGQEYMIMRISEAKDLIATIYSIKKQPHRHPSLFEDFNWYLSAPDWYQEEFGYPFSCCIVRAGSRLGWRWERKMEYTPDYHFEVNWLDPLPAKGSSEYQSYTEALQDMQSRMDRFPFFKGFHQPPTEEVFNRLERQYRPSREEMEMWENPSSSHE